MIFIGRDCSLAKVACGHFRGTRREQKAWLLLAFRALVAGPSVVIARNILVMVARVGFSATTSRESRQGRKAAAAAAMSGAGGKADAGRLLIRGAALNHRLTPHRD